MEARLSPKSILLAGTFHFFRKKLLEKWNESKIIVLQNDGDLFEKLEKRETRIQYVKGDLKNESFLLHLLRNEKVDTVIFLGGGISEESPSASIENDILGMVHLLEACQNYGQLHLFLLAIAENGTSTDLQSAKNKSAELLLNSYHVTYGIPTLLARLPSVYGAGQESTAVIPSFIAQALNEEPFTLDQDAGLPRNWLQVDDAAEGVKLLVEKGKKGTAYNLGGQQQLSKVEVAVKIQSEVAEQIGIAMKPLRFQGALKEAQKPSKRPDNVVDLDGEMKGIGWKCKISFEEGLKETVEECLKKLRTQEKNLKHVLIYGGKGWIGAQVCELLEKSGISYSLCSTRPGHNKDGEIESELLATAPSHVMSLVARTHGPGCGTIDYLEGGPEKLAENVRDNLYAPWLLATLTQKLGIHFTYIGTGCLFHYDEKHSIGGLGYTEEDLPNYFGNSYCVVKGFTDRLLRHYGNTFNCRIRLPINFKLESRNLLVKVAKYPRVFDIPDTHTILPDILPLVLDLMNKGFTGTLNMTSPGSIQISDILQLHRQIIDPTLTWESIDVHHPEAAKMRETRAHCVLDTSKLESMYPGLRNIREAIREGLMRIKDQMNAN